MPKIIHLFRHGQTDWNIRRRLQGHTDIPLNDEGRRQALQLQIFFAQNPVDVILSSDLSRAQETAHIANQILQAPFQTSPNFREVCLGEIEGLTHDEILQRFGETQWKRWQSVNPADFDFAFTDGETGWQALERFKNAVNIICREQDFSTAGLCTHGLMIRRLIHSLHPDLSEPVAVPNCAVFTFHWDENRGLIYQRS